MDWGVVQADVEDDEDGMWEVARKTNVGEWNPETPWQEAHDKTWRTQRNKMKMCINTTTVFGAILFCILHKIRCGFNKKPIYKFNIVIAFEMIQGLGLPP